MNGTAYLESYEDRVAFNALYFADGDEELACWLWLMNHDLSALSAGNDLLL